MPIDRSFWDAVRRERERKEWDRAWKEQVRKDTAEDLRSGRIRFTDTVLAESYVCMGCSRVWWFHDREQSDELVKEMGTIPYDDPDNQFYARGRWRSMSGAAGEALTSTYYHWIDPAQGRNCSMIPGEPSKLPNLFCGPVIRDVTQEALQHEKELEARGRGSQTVPGGEPLRAGRAPDAPFRSVLVGSRRSGY